MKIRIGVVGVGNFSDDFIRLFLLHPDVEKVALADLDAERLKTSGEKYGITDLYSSLDEMLKEGKDLNCIGIFTQRHLHGPMVISALEAGKHVFSAVPIACTIEEIEKIIVSEKEKVVDLVDNDYDPEKKGREFLQKIFDEMKLNVKIDVIKKENYLTFNLTGENLGILIGRRGDTLDALQFLLNLVINEKNSSRVKGIIDVENYRQKREETLIGLSHKLAAKARKTGQKVVLEPMNPQERRIIHIALQDDKRVTTYSEGEEPYRKVVIVPEKKNYDKKQYHHSKNKPQA